MLSPRRQRDLELVLIGFVVGLAALLVHLIVWPGP
jgi:hypothetical protein